MGDGIALNPATVPGGAEVETTQLASGNQLESVRLTTIVGGAAVPIGPSNPVPFSSEDMAAIRELLASGALRSNTNLAEVGSQSISLGQKTARRSIPVVLASDQTPIRNVVSTKNSFTGLAPNGVSFVGQVEDVSQYSSISFIVASYDTLLLGYTTAFLNWSNDQVAWSQTQVLSTSGSIIGSFSFTRPVIAKYFQLTVSGVDGGGGLGPVFVNAQVFLIANASSPYNGGTVTDALLTSIRNVLPVARGHELASSSTSVCLATDDYGTRISSQSLPVVLASDQATITVNGAVPGSYAASGGKGGWTVSGGITAIVAAAKGANTLLAAARAGAGGIIYITRIRLVYSVVTAFAAGAVPTTLVWQRFTAATPTGGTARTPCRKNLATGGATTNLTNVQDLNLALTDPGMGFGAIVGMTLAPAYSVAGSSMEWILNMDDFHEEPLALAANDGICLRTGANAFPATGTWMYSYEIQYFER